MTEDEGAPVYFFLERSDRLEPEVAELQALLRQLFPQIRKLILGFFPDESAVPDFVDKLYVRLKGLVGKSELTEQVVMDRLSSILRENRRRAEARFVADPGPLLEWTEDPGALRFLTRLVQMGELKKFRECVDPWTDQVIKLKLTILGGASDKELADFLRMSPDAFYKRWKRGRDAGLAEYRRRYGDRVP